MEAVLAEAMVLHLGMCDGDRPYVVPMNFAYAGGAIYMHCAAEGRKIDVLRRNPNVFFTAETGVEVVAGGVGCGCSTKYRCVMGEGVVEFVTDRAGKIAGLDALMARLVKGPYKYDERSVEKTCVIRVRVTSMTGKRN
jgi:uncharacterized protein